jgi:tyrosyl-tRNA synthetase
MNMIPGTDGRKMSTSWGNGIFLLDDPRDQFGKIMSMGDEVIATYLESGTQIPMEEVRRIAQGLQDGSVHPMDAKKRLGWEIVRLYHGEEAATRAQEDFERQFQERGLPTEMPTVPMEKALADKATESGEIGILDLLINTGMAPSRKHAQRLVEQGGVRLNDQPVTERNAVVSPEAGRVIKVGRSYVRLAD